MKKEVQKKSESELVKRYPIKGKVEGWYFRTQETSNNAWEVEGSDQWGRKVYRQGDDPKILLEEAVLEAMRISGKSSAT